MFRPRHAYRSPITNRYRGKAKGCPVFNNITDIQSNMVEQHDECLECLAKIKNRSDLYQTLADNNKPSNNVIKSLQRLSHSASNNRLKTCLQFLIIKVNEKSIVTPKQTNATTTTTNDETSPDVNHSLRSHENNTKHTDISRNTNVQQTKPPVKHPNKRQKLFHNNNNNNHNNPPTKQQNLRNKHNHQLASPPQDQVSSTQDQVGPSQYDHDCQTSPSLFIYPQNPDEEPLELIKPEKERQAADEVTIGGSLDDHDDIGQNGHQTPTNTDLEHTSSTNASTTTTLTKTASTSLKADSLEATKTTFGCPLNGHHHNHHSQHQSKSNQQLKGRKHHNSDHDTSSTASWSSSYASPPLPISSASSTSSESSDDSSSSHSSSSTCSSSMSGSASPSPSSSPDLVSELKGPRLKLSEDKIRKIKKRPVLFDDYYMEQSFASTPTTSSGCSPGQHSSTTQNSDQSRLGFPTSNIVVHMFQAPPKFVNTLKPCDLPTKQQEPPRSITPPAPIKEMLNCAICGIKERPPTISKIYGQNSCTLCAKFFAAFLKRPQQLYCAQDGDCLMTFDSRCQACWIKICLQKFDIEEEHRKTGLKYSPKLLSAPYVSLITIDTSLSR